jgi:hypothetical protein
VEIQNVDNMRKLMILEVKYSSEDDGTFTKEERRDEKKRIVGYMENLIDSDFHENYELVIKQKSL